MAVKIASPEKFAERVRRMREYEELSQEQLAIRSGGQLTRAWISRVELGHIRRPSYEKLAALADALGCEIEDVIGIPGEPTPDVLRDALIAEARTMPPELVEMALRLLRSLREPIRPLAARRQSQSREPAGQQESGVSIR